MRVLFAAAILLLYAQTASLAALDDECLLAVAVALPPLGNQKIIRTEVLLAPARARDEYTWRVIRISLRAADAAVTTKSYLCAYKPGEPARAEEIE